MSFFGSTKKIIVPALLAVVTATSMFAGDEQTRLRMKGVLGISLIWIEAGSFMMGCPDKSEIEDPAAVPIHKVNIKKGFWIGKYEVTQQQWKMVMGTSPSRSVGENKPVERVSWNDACEFCKKISKIDGCTYRLPTEAEWEYVAKKSKAITDINIRSYAWYRGNATATKTVGTRLPNRVGAYDMLGNVFEWCSDYYDSNYYSSSETSDPIGPKFSDVEERVVRGGSFDSWPKLRCWHRGSESHDKCDWQIGFRIVREAD